jgi:protein Tob/BTG
MKKECSVASWFWTSQLNAILSPALTQIQLISFQKHLNDILEQRYSNHWYTDDPEKGHAFRSIWFHSSRIDPLLLEAAKKAGITDLSSRMQAEVIMWVDPGLVSVSYLQNPKKVNILYQDPAKQNSLPAEGVCRPMNFETTTIAVNKPEY